MPNIIQYTTGAIKSALNSCCLRSLLLKAAKMSVLCGRCVFFRCCCCCRCCLLLSFAFLCTFFFFFFRVTVALRSFGSNAIDVRSGRLLRRAKIHLNLHSLNPKLLHVFLGECTIALIHIKAIQLFIDVSYQVKASTRLVLQ